MCYTEDIKQETIEKRLEVRTENVLHNINKRRLWLTGFEKREQN